MSRGLLAVAVLLLAPSLSAYEFRTNGGGTPLHWETGPLPIPYYIDGDGCDDIADGSDLDAIQSAFQSWENVSSGRIEFRFIGTVDTADMPPDANIILWMNDDWPFDPGYVAKTRVHYSEDDGRILRVEIMLNGRDYRWSTNGKTGTLDVRNVATHEIGHFIGLSDLRESARTMFEFINPDETEKTILSGDEMDAVHAAYPLIADNERAEILPYLLSYDLRSLRPGSGALAEAEPAPFMTLLAFGSPGSPAAGPGLLSADSVGLDLSLIKGDGSHPARMRIEPGSGVSGRIRAACTLDLDGDGARDALALFISGGGGMSVRVAAVPPGGENGGVIRADDHPIEGAEDVVSCDALYSNEEGIGDLLASVEKRHNSDSFVTLSRVVASGDGGLALDPLRSWRIPDCASVIDMAVLGSPGEEPFIAVLARSAAGELQIVLYSPPFAPYPDDGEAVAPLRRVDASAIEESGRPIALCAGDGERSLAVLVAR